LASEFDAPAEVLALIIQVCLWAVDLG